MKLIFIIYFINLTISKIISRQYVTSIKILMSYFVLLFHNKSLKSIVHLTLLTCHFVLATSSVCLVATVLDNSALNILLSPLFWDTSIFPRDLIGLLSGRFFQQPWLFLCVAFMLCWSPAVIRLALYLVLSPSP